MNNEVIKQWDDAARLYFSSQEESDFVKVNKDVVRNRFNKLTNEKVLDLDVGMGIILTILELLAAVLLAVTALKRCYP